MLRACLSTAIALVLLLQAQAALAESWGADLSPAYTSDGLQVAINTRYRLWKSHEFLAGLRAFPPGVRDDWPLGGQLGYRYRFRGRVVRPLFGPEYQLTRHRGGTWHSLFWAYGIEVPLKYGVALENTLGIGASCLDAPRYAIVAPDALLRFAVIYRFGGQSSLR